MSCEFGSFLTEELRRGRKKEKGRRNHLAPSPVAKFQTYFPCKMWQIKKKGCEKREK